MSNRTTEKSFAAHAVRRDSFQASSTHAVWIGPGGRSEAGRLPAEWVEALNAATEQRGAYVVFSYSTPIAWYVHPYDAPEGDERFGGWTIPDVTYSPTTTRAQNRLRDALDDAGFYVESYIES
jgi:hypothetical protein